MQQPYNCAVIVISNAADIVIKIVYKYYLITTVIFSTS